MRKEKEKETTNLMEKAHQLIRNMMLQHKLSPGQKIIYRDLSEKLNMSKTPIMYALGRLEQEGFVELIPNQGYIVKELDLKEIEDFFDVREALETYAIGLAIKSMKPENLKALEEKIRQHREYVTPVYDRKRMVLDADIHLYIALMSGNRVLARQLHQIFEHLFLRYRLELMHSIRPTSAPAEHQKMLSLIRKRDISGAQKVMRTHIQSGKQGWLTSFTRKLDNDELMIPKV
jgi:DNA-binding GntR family transcriptional regulator